MANYRYDMPMTALKTFHKVITLTCRKNKGEAAALGEVEELMVDEYLAVLQAHPKSRIHIIMYVEPGSENE